MISYSCLPRILSIRLILLVVFWQIVASTCAMDISANDIAIGSETLTAHTLAAEVTVIEKLEYKSDLSYPEELTSESLAIESSITDTDKSISPDDIAIESELKPLKPYKPQRIKTPTSQIVQYAKNFWDEAEKEVEERKIEISGTKTFEMKQADVTGDISHFSTENYESIPGFKLDQGLHLEVSGNITDTASVNAILDDTDGEDRRFTINIDGPVWKFVMGDFPLAIEDTEFALFRKEVRGIMAAGSFHKKIKSIFLFSQSKGLSRREQFRGAGQQQEFRLAASPMVQNSETVTIDGVNLVRGIDYYVDYEDGLIKFMPEILPIEITSWIVVEYEVADSDMAFIRNLFGTRQIYLHEKDKQIGLTWLQEIDGSSPKYGEATDESGAEITPMQHDIYGIDAKWQLSPNILIDAETAVSVFDPNRNSDKTEADKAITGHATRFELIGHGEKADGELAYRRIDSSFKSVGREGGVLELGERGLVNDIMSGRAIFNYKLSDNLTTFTTGELSETNLDDDPTFSSIEFEEYTGGLIWTGSKKNRLEIRAGHQRDNEMGIDISSDMSKDTSAAVWDRSFGKLNTQSKIDTTKYVDSINIASV